MKKDERGDVIDYMRVHSLIPRDEKNDPHFTFLGEGIDWDKEDEENNNEERDKLSLLSVFSPKEVVLMVNRFLYQMEYQRSWHRKWERQKQEELGPLKAKVKELFGVSWTKASEEQIRQAAKQLKEKKC